MSSYLYFPNNLRYKRPHIGLHDKLQNLFPINGNSFQRKLPFIATNSNPQTLFIYHVHNQADFDNLFINGRDVIYLDISKMIFIF